MIERQVITTWTTPEQELPPEDYLVVVTFSGRDRNCHYDHTLGIGSYWDGDGWIITGLSDKAEFTVHAWADLDPYKGGGMKDLEEILTEICDRYCKWPEIWDEEKEGMTLMDAKCADCPLNRLEEL